MKTEVETLKQKRPLLLLRASSVLTIFALFVALGLMPGHAALSPPKLERAEPGEASYLLSDFSVQHPYVRAGEWTKPTDEIAAVYFDVQFATNDFPGPTECYLELLDEDGGVTGSTTTVLNVLDPVESNDNGGFPVAVPTTGDPTSARGHCARGTYDPGQGYVLEFLGEREVPEGYPGNRVELVFASRWTGDVQPGWRNCTLEVRFTDGTEEKLPGFNLFIGEPNHDVVQTPEIPKSSSVADAELLCRGIGF